MRHLGPRGGALTLLAVWCAAVVAQDQSRDAGELIWRWKTDSASIDLSNPLVVGDLVIVGTGNGRLLARRCADGTLVWEHEHGMRIYDRPDFDSERIYFTSEHGLVAVSRVSGELRWGHRIEHGGGRCIVVPSKGLVVAGGNDGLVHAVDAKTAETRWQTSIIDDAPPELPDFPAHRGRGGGNSLARPTGMACDDERVYQSIFDQCRVVALDAETGKSLWSHQTKGWIYGSPLIAGEFLFIGSQDKCLHCLEKRTGKKVWQFETKGRIEKAAAADDRSLFFGSCDGSYYRIAQADGALLWKFDTEPDYSGIRAIYSTPIVTADTIYFAAAAGHLYALDKETGALRWKLSADEHSQTLCSPASDGQRLFIITRPDWDKRGENSLVAITQR
jgi:outer membrane protein assembly factor BamB